MNYENPEHYDTKLGFVSQLGQGVVDLLNPQRGERILDLGCGTGELSQTIAARGSAVVGIDLSASMIAQAKRKYPEIQFEVGNAERLTLDTHLDATRDTRFDAVFSNAALHWMKRKTSVIEHVWNLLRPGGRFVAEFGGRGNVGHVVHALECALAEIGIDAKPRNPWYFPSVAEYATLLERQGFRVTYAVHFDRPTPMVDGDGGLEHWLQGFAQDYFSGLESAQVASVIGRVVELTRTSLYRDGQWIIDYKRLRIQAIKERADSEEPSVHR